MPIPSAIYGPILDAIASGAVRITEHAMEAMRDDAVTLDDVLHATTSGEVIEDYPGGFPFPSCLCWAEHRMVVSSLGMGLQRDDEDGHPRHLLSP